MWQHAFYTLNVSVHIVRHLDAHSQIPPLTITELNAHASSFGLRYKAWNRVSVCVCVPLHCLFSKAAGMLQTLGERKVPAWKVIADCSVGSVQCASLVFFVSNQSFKFPALSGVGCVNLHARLLAENDPIYQLFGYLCVFLFCWGRIDWVAIYKLAWGAIFYVWCALSFSAVYGEMWLNKKMFFFCFFLDEVSAFKVFQCYSVHLHLYLFCIFINFLYILFCHSISY